MKLVAFRDPAWSRVMGAVVSGRVDYTFSISDTLSYVAKRQPYLVFLSAMIAEPAGIGSILNRAPSALVVYVGRPLTSRQRRDALAAGAYEAIDMFTDGFPYTVAQIIDVARDVRGFTSSSTLPKAAPILRLIR